jgi:hypothetical protein
MTQVFAPRKAGREGMPEGPVRPTRHPTHPWPNGQVKRVIRIYAPHRAEPWPCAQEFVALADRKEAHANGRSPVVPADA